MLPISCELSPSRLMRLDVSWIVSRIVFMPSMVRRTASPPLCATSTECRATSDERSALPETSSIELAMDTMDSVAALISLRWLSAARAMFSPTAARNIGTDRRTGANGLLKPFILMS